MCETAVSSGTQGSETEIVETVAVKQGQEIPQKTRETLCSTPLTKAPKIRKSKCKPNASVKTAEVANARKVAMERDYEQTAQFREEHRATMTYRKKEHILKMKVLMDEGKPMSLGMLFLFQRELHWE
ncbi:uncharacterized protein TNCV_3466381 [Trichonephila clavipes]|nr:uncharacterized protein TNCV_3466381 [Trichonephila clavipes]